MPEDGHATGARGGDWEPEVILRALDAGPNVRVESKAAKYLPENMGDYVGTLIYTAWSTGGGHYVCLVRRPEGIFEVDRLDRRRHQKPATPQRIAASMGGANFLRRNVFSTSRHGNRGREVSPRKRRRTATDLPEAATGRQTATPDQERCVVTIGIPS